MKKSIRIYISGVVQGVFFRNYIQENAEKLNIKGFVRNLEDGRIEIFIEGDIDAVKKMLSICEKGPKHSQIRKIEVKPERFQGFRTFKILHI
jgi:acylphosphatase